MQLSRGARLRSFEVLGPLGAGGMGAVYRAHDSRLGRDVAIKVLQERFGGSAQHLERFKREARAASALNHPNIVTIFEIDEAGGVPFIAMELVDGRSLRDHLQSRHLSLRKVLDIATQIADGLAAAHERGIVHRDLKPENVMITPEDRVKILDFGLARFDEPTSSEDSTVGFSSGADGRVVGTASYMSPEQASGSPEIDYRSDQFALGAILYEMLTGRRAFSGATTMETLAAVMRDDPEPLTALNPDVPVPLRWIVERCLAKNKSERYHSTTDLARDLRTIRERLPETTSGSHPAARRRWRAIGAAAVVGVALAGGVAAVYVGRVNRTGESRAVSQIAQSHIAVVPFKDEGGASDAQLFSVGLSEAVRQRLGDYTGVKVVDPRFTPATLGNDTALHRVAQTFGARLLLTAGVRRTEDDLHVNYSLLDMMTGRTVARRTIRGRVTDLWRLRDQIAASVVSDVGLRTGVRADRTGLPSPEDQELYVQALGTLEQARDAKAADAAIERFRELLETAPDSPLVHASLGRAYYVKFGLTMDRQWLDRAGRAARRAVALDPDAPETLVTLGMVETIHGNYGQAVASFERALTLQPTSAIAAIGLGQAFIAERRYDDAERMYRRAIGLNPAWWQGHHELANLFWFRKRYDDALREYNEVIRLDPDRSTGYTGKGAVLLIKERLPEAAQAFRKALSLNEDASALANLTYCQFYSGEYDQAVETIRRALRLQPTRSHFWAYLAEASASSSSYRGEAARAYRTAAERARAELAINSDYARSHATLAVALAHAGDFKGARRSIARAREIAPDTATHLFNAARIANLAGDSAESVALLKQALERGTPRIEVERHPEFQNLRESGALRDVLRPPA